MKRAVLIIAGIVLMTANGNCQWYHRQYGVNDINQLSKEQLKESLKRAQRGARTGGIVTAIGGIGLIGGIVTIISVKDREDEGSAYTGVFLTAISIPVEITGLTVWGVNGNRKYNINKALKNMDIKVGLKGNPAFNIKENSNAHLMPCISLTFHL